MTRQEFDNYSFQKPDPKPEQARKQASDTRRFWLLSVPLGIGVGLLGAGIASSATAFLPITVVAAFLIQSLLENK